MLFIFLIDIIRFLYLITQNSFISNDKVKLHSSFIIYIKILLNFKTSLSNDLISTLRFKNNILV